MAAIAFVGDSFCSAYNQEEFYHRHEPEWQHGSTEPTFIDRVVTTNRYTLYPYGFGGKSWWYSRQRFIEDLNRIPADIFENQLEVIVFCHTNSGRINNAWNRRLSNTDITSPEAQLYYRNIFDGDFNDWAQEQWFREINRRWGHLKTIHFHCFKNSIKLSHLLPGVVFTTPLIHISAGELVGTELEIHQQIIDDKRMNHLSAENNLVLGEIILEAIYTYQTGPMEIDLKRFNIVNPNAVNFPNKGYGTK